MQFTKFRTIPFIHTNKKLLVRYFLTIAFMGLIQLQLPESSYAFDPSIHDKATRQELKNLGFDADSADEVSDSNFYTDTAEAANSNAHGDNNQLGGASKRLKDKMTAIGNALNECKRRSALDSLGEALHTTQDIYSHSNSIDDKHSIDLLNLSNGTAFCFAAPKVPNFSFAPTGLISGYFNLAGYLHGWPIGFPTDECTGLPTGQCCHRELNKDNSKEINGARHLAALSAARSGTKTYMTLLEDDIKNRFSEDDANRFLKMLKKKQRKNYFVIDDTGSMSEDIAGVKSTVNSFLNQLSSSDEAPTLGLVTFKDSPSLHGEFCDIESLRSQIAPIFASGGGDCPEASNAALTVALQQFPIFGSDVELKGGRILLATDASAGDAALGPLVKLNATTRGVNIDAILTGDCFAEEGFAAASALKSSSEPQEISYNSPSDQALAPSIEPKATALALSAADPLTSRSARTQLRALTEQTGGVLFEVNRSEVDDVVPTLLELSDPNVDTIFTEKVTFSGEPVTINIPIDSTFNTRATFMVSLSQRGILPSITLIKPDGTLVDVNAPGIKRLRLSSVDSITVNNPEQGLWKIQLEGSSQVLLRVFGPTQLSINGLRLFDPLNVPPARPEIEFMPLIGAPTVGSTIIAEIRLTDDYQNPSVILVRLDGTIIKELPVEVIDGFLRVSFEVPNETFRIQISGTTSGSSTFTRQIVVPITAQTVSVSANPQQNTVSPGKVAEFKVLVTNLSPATTTYQMQFSSSLAWSIKGPLNFSIDSGAQAEFSVSVFVPASATEGEQNNINILVTDINNPTTRNSSTVTVVAGSSNEPPNCDNAAASLEVLWPPDHSLIPIGIEGITDPDGDSVSISINSITQDEPVIGKASGNTSPDGTGIGRTTANIRRERNGTGDGRVYAISFLASDGNGGECSNTVNVSVPHDASSKAINSGQNFDSTE